MNWNFRQGHGSEEIDFPPATDDSITPTSKLRWFVLVMEKCCHPFQNYAASGNGQ
jgi:hypothetical protein